MKKRFTFSCWWCEHTYTLFKEITDQQQLIEQCPYCNAEAVVALTKYPKRTISVFRDAGNEQPIQLAEYILPDIIPTEKPA